MKARAGGRSAGGRPRGPGGGGSGEPGGGAATAPGGGERTPIRPSRRRPSQAQFATNVAKAVARATSSRAPVRVVLAPCSPIAVFYVLYLLFLG